MAATLAFGLPLAMRPLTRERTVPRNETVTHDEMIRHDEIVAPSGDESHSELRRRINSLRARYGVQAIRIAFVQLNESLVQNAAPSR
jgi:hypothetical protein